MNKAVFLDRDGTINVDKGYVYKIEDFEFLPGAVEALQIFQRMGYKLIIITNQSGIGRGYYAEEDFERLNDYMRKKLLDEGVEITDVLFCPHLPDAKIERYRKTCDCRKPNIGLYIEAQKKWDVDMSRSYAIGDRIRDCTVSLSTECKGYVIENSVEKKKLLNNKVKYSGSLLEVAKEIAERENDE